MSMDVLRVEAVGDWQQCGDCFYSRELLHDMKWEDIDLQTKRLSCAPFGGPIAVIRDERQMVEITGATMQPVVRLFTASGQPLGNFMWDTSCRLVDWGWTSLMQLACVETNGMVTLRGLTGGKLKEFSMGNAAATEGVVAAVVAGSAVAVLTRALGLWLVADVGTPRPARLPTPALDPDLVDSCRLALLLPHQTLTGSIEVLMVGGSKGVMWVIDGEGCTEHVLAVQPPSAINTIRVSPCGAFVALMTEDGRLLVMASDLSRKLSEFETHADTPPCNMEWCGSDSVVLQWPALLLVVGPYGDYTSWSTHDDTVVMSSEVDGVRLIGNHTHELLRKVPAQLAQVFQPGSTSPATQLWDARALFDAGNARCDKILRTLAQAGELPSAVTCCIEAAGNDLSIPRQKALMQAAAYGRVFCAQDFPTQLMSVTAQHIRLVNALKDPQVGLPVTTAQLQALGIPAVLARLVLYRQWLLAYRIAGSLTWAPSQLLSSDSHKPASSGPTPAFSHASSVLPLPGSSTDIPSTQLSTLPVSMAGGVQVDPSLPPPPAPPPHTPASLQEAVLSAWACARISAAAHGGSVRGAAGDVELKTQLMAKLVDCLGMRYAPLAAHAQSVGRRRLALLLLEEETSCALQVPLLLSLAESYSSSRKSSAGRQGDGDGEDEGEDPLARALKRAIESGDSDLVLHVLFHAYRHRPVADFWQLVCSRALARNLFVKYCKAREPELLETLLTTSGQPAELAELKMIMTLSNWVDARAKNTPIDTAVSALQSGLATVSSKYALSRDHVFQSKAATDLATLRREQVRLERETGQQLWVGLSLEATLQELIRMGHHKHAATLRKQFSLGDRHWWWLKIRVLAESRCWEALDAFAAEKKSPVGYEPFYEVAKRYGAPREVQARLIARLPDSAAKAEAYTAIEFVREAAEVAGRLKDSDLLRHISSAVSAASPAGLAIAQIKERFFGSSAGSMGRS